MKLFKMPAFSRVLLALSVFCIHFTKAQQADKNKHIEVAENLKKEYNAKNYKVLYSFLDKDFQKQMSEKELSDFFKFNIYDYYGDIVKITYKDHKNSFHNFDVELNKGKLDLALSCNEEGKISGMQWLPHKEISPVTKINPYYLSDNAKTSFWDLKVDSIVKNYMLNADNCGLSIAIINNEETTYYNYGQTKRKSNQLPGNKTIYEIGSISKTFTGILLSQAIIDKKLSLNDDIKKYLPGDYKNLEYKGKRIEIVHLANHTSRIPRVPSDIAQQKDYDPKNPYKNYNKEMVFNYLKTITIDTLPGVKSEYSNLGMALLGIILETVYKKPYEELITEFICKPFQMPNTKLYLNTDEQKNFATGYDSYGEEVTHWDLGDLAAAGGLRSTTTDMVNYVNANMNESNAAVKLSHSSTFNDGRNNTGLAWQILTTKKSNELIWHNGGTYGFVSFCGFIKSKKCGVVVLSNSAGSVDYIALGILKLLQ
jgi:CubicO group peptidase (beta-lactamase class C family)